jgi:adenosyl cobinamide kinase/adenosyl cobinamide phosphate guanylyltransferase/NaMN:DMB phosphoribosyltransferase
MSHDGYHTVLVLGGVRSGKSEFAETLVADAPGVRYVATAVAPGQSTGNGQFPGNGQSAGAGQDDEWAERIAAHQARRPAHWTTDEIGAAPERLAALIAATGPTDTLLVDDLGGWLTAVLGAAAGPFDAGWSADAAHDPLAELSAAVSSCAGRLVIVSSEVGLSLVPTTVPGRAFTDALGIANQALAALVDSVVLVVAGQPSWLKGAPGTPAAAAAATVAAPESASAAAVRAAGVSRATAARAAVTVAAANAAAASVTDAARAPRPQSETVTLGSGTELAGSADEPEINSRMTLPLPDDTAAAAAVDRLHTLDVPGAGLGNLAKLVGFVAGTQGTATPVPFRAPRLMLVHGTHTGGLAAGDTVEDWQREVDRAVDGGGALGLLAGTAGVPIQVVDLTAEPAAPVEDGDAASREAVETALRQGFRLAEAAVDSGTDLIVLGAAGAGQIAAAAAVVATTVSVDPAAVLPRVVRSGGRIDDNAWMLRCAALRDGLHRVRGRLLGSVDTLVALGGYDLAVAAGIILGATYRRTPVMIDGPVGVAAGMLARDLAAQSRLWLLMADTGGHPTVTPAAKVLGLTPFADLRLDLGEGAAALAVLPLVRNALLLGTLPPVGSEPEPADDDLAVVESSSAW